MVSVILQWIGTRSISVFKRNPSFSFRLGLIIHPVFSMVFDALLRYIFRWLSIQDICARGAILLSSPSIRPRPPMAGKSSGGGLLGHSIGIAPPRLLYGRAASYGSIINPVCLCCHRLGGSSPPFAGGFIARPDFSGVLAHLPVRLRLSACIQECTW